MNVQLILEPAGTGDVSAVHRLLIEAAMWLRSRGINQWPDFPRSYVEDPVERGEIMVLRDAESICASVQVLASDRDVWGKRPPDALYVHQLVVARSHSGCGLGRTMLDLLAARAASFGRQFLRLDCWEGNAGLRSYYEDAGFTHRGNQVVTPGGGQSLTVARYERPVI
jgi:ribosomal protein S18 acetylase RimI-like enzyme